MSGTKCSAAVIFDIFNNNNFLTIIYLDNDINYKMYVAVQ